MTCFLSEAPGVSNEHASILEHWSTSSNSPSSIVLLILSRYDSNETNACMTKAPPLIMGCVADKFIYTEGSEAVPAYRS